MPIKTGMTKMTTTTSMKKRKRPVTMKNPLKTKKKNSKPISTPMIKRLKILKKNPRKKRMTLNPLKNHLETS